MRTTNTFLVVDVGGTFCAIPLPYVIETMRPLPIKALPGVPVAVLGAAVIRGRAVPVLNLAALLATPVNVPFKRFVTVRTEPEVIAIAVTGVVGIRELEAEGTNPLPPLLSAAKEHAVGEIEHLDRELMLVLDATRLIPEEFMARVGREEKDCQR